MTQAINKFPAGTSSRWQVIADFVGKPLKETISKAKEMAEKRTKDVEAKREAEAALKAKKEQYRLEAKQKAAADAAAKKKTAAKEEEVDPNAWTA